MGKARIQKILADMGIASRRAIEEMVLEGRIEVNGKLIGKLPCFVDPEQDEIEVDGKLIRQKRPDKKVYFLVNKPKNVVCTSHDPEGRRCITDLIPQIPQRVYCVGRLDKDSTGVIILTNDGELTERLTHPRFGVMKTYVVEVDGRLDPEEVERLKRPMYIDGKRTVGTWVKILRNSHERSTLEIRLREGRNREIRRVLARLGHKVRRLKRTTIGPITDHKLGIGNFRELTTKEVQRLQTDTEGRSTSRKTSPKRTNPKK